MRRQRAILSNCYKQIRNIIIIIYKFMIITISSNISDNSHEQCIRHTPFKFFNDRPPRRWRAALSKCSRKQDESKTFQPGIKILLECTLRGCRKEDYAAKKRVSQKGYTHNDFPHAIVRLMTCVRNSEYLLILLYFIYCLNIEWGKRSEWRMITSEMFLLTSLKNLN